MQARKATEIALVRQAQEGGVEAFTELFNRWNSPLLQYLYHMLGDRQEAEDMAQDAFLRAYENLPRLGPPWDFKSWLYQIASNLTINHLKRQRRFINTDEPDEVSTPDMPSSPRSPERQVESQEQQRQVWKALGTLPTLYRQALVLREINELSYEEIRVALDCSYENARQLVHRARLRFREEYGFTRSIAAGVPRCRVLGDLLSAYHDDQLTGDDRRRVEEHMRTCEDCRETRKDMMMIGAFLLGMPRLIPDLKWMNKVRDGIRTSAGATPHSGNGNGSGGGSGGSEAPGDVSAPPEDDGHGGGRDPAPAPAPDHISRLGFAGLGLLVIAAILLGLLWWFRSVLPAVQARATATYEFRVLSDEGTATAEAISTALEAERLDATPTAEALLLLAVSPSPTATLTATPGPATMMLTLDRNANCRSGPGSGYEATHSFLQGESLQVDGRNEMAPWWWQVVIPNSQKHCWISSIAGQPDGDPDQLKVVKAPESVPGQSSGGAPGAPPAPSYFDITNHVCTDKQYSLTLVWNDNSTNESGFHLYRGGTLIATVGKNVTKYTDSPPGSGPYVYTLEAFNGAGASATQKVNEAGCLY